MLRAGFRSLLLCAFVLSFQPGSASGQERRVPKADRDTARPLLLEVHPTDAPPKGSSNAPAELEARRAALKEALDEQWQYLLRTQPLAATFIGEKRYNDRLQDYSQQAVDANLEQNRRFLTKFEAIDTTGFAEQEAITAMLMKQYLQLELESARFRPWEMPTNQFDGLHITLSQLGALTAFSTEKDYEDYISRLGQIPRVLEQAQEQMRKGMAQGRMPPRSVMSSIQEQLQTIAGQSAEASEFSQPFRTFPAAVAQEARERLSKAGFAAIRERVLPAYAKLAAFVRDEYGPKGRTQPGIWSLPDGEAYYAYLIRDNTTTTLTPEQIHQLGLAQVKAIEERMLEIAHQQGYADLKSFNTFLRTDPRFRVKSRQEILQRYQENIDQMRPKLAQFFGRLPLATLEVRPVEEFREKDAPFAQYWPAAIGGSRPGRVIVNTGDFEHRTWLAIETTAYHEGVPGHHLQVSIAQELGELPPCRRFARYTAYVEGWALYAEALGEDAGLYRDPYSRYGHLQAEMLRAIRLVVDTGYHYKKWTRQQVIDFFHEHSSQDEPSVQAEADRYMVMPAQALAYKIGQLEILRLRQYAKEQLGDRFDLRSFHDEVLGAGALPLDLLSVRVQSWVAKEKAKAR